MQMVVTCWADPGCDQDFTVEAPTRNTDELVEGVPVQCPNCGTKYLFTVDGDGEPSLDAVSSDALGENIE